MARRVRRTIETSRVFSVPQAEGVWKQIGTHDGTFHCDEVLAISMLRLLPAYKDSVIVRTRDAAKLACCDIVVDVGAVYDPDALRFDHHQRGFTGTLEGFGTKLSSAGLIYKHFGLSVVKEVAGEALPASVLDKLYRKTYEGFLEHIDGIDNGISVVRAPEGHSEEELTAYKIETHLPARVARLNPSWNEEETPEGINQRFSVALEMVSSEFVDFLSDLVSHWWPARMLVEGAFGERATAHPTGQVMVLRQYAPWIAHLFDLEHERGVVGLVKYVLYTDNKGQWRIHAVPEKVGSFVSRLALPEPWRGVRDQALSDVAGIPGCTFVHANGFTGGHATLEGALRMAELALKQAKEKIEARLT